MTATLSRVVKDLAKTMGTVLSKLKKLDNIKSRLDNLFKAVSNIENTVANLDKDINDLKEKVKRTDKMVKELEESINFNDEEIAELKRNDGDSDGDEGVVDNRLPSDDAHDNIPLSVCRPSADAVISIKEFRESMIDDSEPSQVIRASHSSSSVVRDIFRLLKCGHFNLKATPTVIFDNETGMDADGLKENSATW
ncbi:hypothetical protein OS493_009060 [Desmophyllum pertusum]|uniref:Uncharacterized protein n=1 Tax=Desmophyllum pertusum TaxID=174260 RepID=A0A9X0CZX6_9CNID|nr:hypothetical protein OS493_009060 [Desmophyllum pertusum]